MASAVSSAMNPVSSISAAAPAAPKYRPEEYSVSDIVQKFFSEKAKDFSKLLAYTTFWVGEAMPALPSQAKRFSSTMGDFKNFISLTEVPKKVIEVVNTSTKLWGDRTVNAARSVFDKVTTLTNSVVDSIDFGSRFLPINEAVMGWLKGVNSVATLGGAGNKAVEHIQKLTQTTETDTQKRALYVINLAGNVAYIAVGAMGLASFAAGVAIVPAAMVGALTVGLITTITSFVFEKLYDPEGTGKNFNPDAVLHNKLEAKKAGAVV